MSAQHYRRTAADNQAANWIARLGTRSISLQTIEEFAQWRRDPVNAQAYQRAEQLWAESNTLSGDPDIQAALDSAMQRRPKARRLKPVLMAGLATAMAVALVVGFTMWEARGVYRTRVGEQTVVQLADGSRVRLDTDTRLKIRFSDGERHIDLTNGQAFFEVAHDPGRPFVVSTSDASVTAVGTVFEVRHIGDVTRVVLVSGAVDVAQARTGVAPQRLSPNQQSAILRGQARVSPVDAVVATSWTGGELVFVDTPLADAVAEMNRYLADPIVLDAPAAARTSINGVFRSGDRAAFVAAAAQLLNLRTVTEPDGRVRLIGPGNIGET
ncbi:sigma factor regulatory protein, FecR/PupR family [Brevundimonas diminuta 470-4]|jgi:transmembrane sensor|nr:sigma factor regulatory protein, FecR/PupR family [Brevundimonas diminuta 470-4]